MVGKSRFTVVLVTVAILFLVATLLPADGSVMGINLFRLAFSIVVVTVALISTDARRDRWAVGLLAAAWLVLNWAVPDQAPGATTATAKILSVVILFYAGVLLIKVAVTADRITVDTVNGAIAAYLILAVAWAVSFQLIDVLAVGSFSADLAGDFQTALYFSLTTITTLGYGDITPMQPFARIWATLEAAVGLFYVAVLIARLVSEFKR